MLYLRKTSVMNTTYFHSSGTNYVELDFDCPKCSHNIQTDGFSIPVPNNTADNSDESESIAEFDIACDNCDKEFNILITVGFGGGYVEIMELDSSAEVFVTEISAEEEFIDDQIETYLYDTEKMKVFRTEISKLKQLLNINIKDLDVEKTLLKQVYTGTITCLEDYLSATLIQAVINNKNTLKSFVKKDKVLKDQTFTLSEIYEKYERIEKIVKERLLGIQYHNMPLVKALYKIAFSYEIPDISEVSRMVSNRHDLVHRNGRRKDGSEVIIDRTTVNLGIETVERFVQSIDNVVGII